MNARIAQLGTLISERATAVVAVLVIVFCLFLPELWSSQLSLINIIQIYAVAALGLQMIMGVGGQASIGTAALMAIGATICGELRLLQVNAFLCIVAAIVGAAIVGLLVGVSALRLRGIYLIIATLALQFAVTDLLENLQLSQVGPDGFRASAIQFGSFAFDSDPRWFYLLLPIVTVASLLALKLRRSSLGRNLLAVQGLDRMAAVYGINVTASKVTVFGLGSGLAGLSGALLAEYIGYVQIETFTLDLAIAFIAMLVLGGINSVGGTLVGVVVVEALPLLVSNVGSSLTGPLNLGTTFQNDVPAISTAIYGVLIVVVMSFKTDGIAGLVRAVGEKLGSSLKRTRAESPEPLDEPREVLLQLAADREHEDRWLEEKRVSRPSTPLLILENLSVEYAGTGLALSEVSLSLFEGDIVAVLGHNGAGKTTCIKSIIGFDPADNARIRKGAIRYFGSTITRWPSYKRHSYGIAAIPSGIAVFEKLTVEENLSSVVRSRHSQLKDRDESQEFRHKKIEQLVTELFPELQLLLDKKAGQLSGGERQMLVVARALLTDPSVLLADEVSLGLAPGLTIRVLESLARLRDELGIAVVIAEQNANAALQVADYVYVLSVGQIAIQGSASEILNAGKLTKEYLG